MKKSLISSLILLFAINISAYELSRSGAAHWRAAETLMEMASTKQDTLQVVDVYENVVKSDPQYPEVYMKLGLLYSRLTIDDGEPTYNRAKECLNKYIELNPDGAEAAEAELIVLEAMMRKYENGPVRMVGTWMQVGVRMLKITYNGKSYDVKWLFPGCSKTEITPTENGFDIVVTYHSDYRSELLRKGYTQYSGQCEKDAAIGYPTQGNYLYNEEQSTSYWHLDLSGEVPILCRIKKEIEYYLDGVKTYARLKDKGFPNKLKKEV